MKPALLLIAAGAFALGDLTGVFSGSLDHPAIEYTTRPVDDAVARLNRRIDQGLALTYEPQHGYLPALLAALNIPVESQIATFAKASFQQHLIGPNNARAIYFNDSVVVGWVRGAAMLEVASEDPRQGTIFYALSQRPGGRAKLVRRDDCLTCHESYDTLGVPGMLLRSVYPDRGGNLQREFGSFNTDHRLAFEHRWGGWFVTAATPLPKSLGNTFFRSVTDAEPAKPDLTGYLSPGSDIAALMAFDHQMRMTNLLTRVGWEARFAAHENRMTAAKLEALASETARFLLFADEPKLESPLRGLSGFAESFAARGPLRQFDLNTRMMKYRCSYMIYSEAFDALPDDLRTAISRHIAETLQADGETATLEILRATKQGF